MKLVVFALVFTLCNLNASEFISPDDLVKSLLDKPEARKSVGTVFATNLDTQTASNGAGFSVSTGTCFAVSKRHFITGSHILSLIGDLRDCFISMADELCEGCVLSPTFKGPLYQKVKSITREPNGANLAILELYEDLDIVPLTLGKFNKAPSTGISTAFPTKACMPATAAKLKHTFSYDGLLEGEDSLKALFVVPTTVMPDDVRSHTITSDKITLVGYGSTSIFTDGDDGAPLLQGNEVVAVSNGWSLCIASIEVVAVSMVGAFAIASIEEKPVHLLTNKFTKVTPHMDWIQSIASPKAEEAKEKEIVD